MALLVGLTADLSGDEIDSSYWELVDRLIQGLVALQGDCEELIKFGDEDGAVLLDLGQKAFGAVPSLMNTACRVLGNPYYEPRGLEQDLKTAFFCMFRNVPLSIRNAPPKKHFEFGGYTILEKEKIRLIFDAGPLGFRSIAAHGHADALSFICFFDRIPVLVDPGTYQYYCDEAIRNYFRSTFAHNTLVLDDENQSAIAGPFMWGRKAECRTTKYVPGESITASHDGYAKKKRPSTHSRTIRILDPRCVEVIDSVDSLYSHDLELNFHFSPHCKLIDRGNNLFLLGEREWVRLEIPSFMSSEYYFGSEAPLRGWFSPEFGRREPVYTLTLRGRSSLNKREEITTKIFFEGLN